MAGPPFLRGDDVVLRPVETEDAEFLQRLSNDPDVREGTGNYEPLTVEDQESMIEEVDTGDDRASFVVTVDEERVGFVTLQHVNDVGGRAEVGYFFDPNVWGNGYATDAVETIVEYAFNERRLHKLFALLFVENDGSRRVLEKVGFEREGHFREHFYHDGEYRDRYQYGLLADEWRDDL